MRVLILNQFFYPDMAATSQFMTDLAEDLAALGTSVTAVSGTQGYRGGEPLPAQDQYRGVSIVRVRSSRFDRSSIVRRLLSYLSFYFGAFFRILRLPRQDALIVLTTPPLIVAVGCALKFFTGCRVFYLVQDLYPDLAVRLEVLPPNAVVTRWLEKVSRFCLRYCDAVIVLGDCMRRQIERKNISAEKIRVIQNWADATQLRSIPDASNPFRTAHQLEGKFVVLYSGNLGQAHDVTTILAAAEKLSVYPEIVFLFIADGVKKDEVSAFAAQRGLTNIRLLPYQPREELSFSLSAGDVSLVSLRADLEGLLVPSKLYGIMAVGRPVIYIGPPTSEVGRTVQEADCGFVAENGNADALTAAILACYADPSLAQRLGGNARRALEHRFDRHCQTKKYYELLQDFCGQTAVGASEVGRQTRTAAVRKDD